MDSSITLRSVEFASFAKSAVRLWILDPHFDQPWGIEPLTDILRLSGITDLRINGGKGIPSGEREKISRQLRELLETRTSKRIVVAEWRDTINVPKFTPLHDRFAIVDNELWHFGCTVGGANRSISALSRGWHVASTRAVEFFEELWARKV